jgi:glutamine amidotransferase
VTAAVIIDSGGANIASLRFALGRLGCEATLTRDPAVIRDASHVMLPGVGAAKDAMDRLRAADLDVLIPTLRQPVLGICLGMQLLFEASEEGPADCLGVIDDRVRALRAAPDRPIPHMGWNRVRPRRDCALFEGVEDGAHLYFVHSYAARESEHTVATASYGENFSAAVGKANFFGTQFHPERSGPAGARVLRNSLEMGQ